MQFPNVSSDTRQRIRVRGRVLCFTTSLVVEYLEQNQKFSYPLYSHAGPYPAGCGLTFQVEVSGYLTFDQDAQVKLIELDPYQRFDFDPSRFVVSAPAGYSCVVVSATISIGNSSEQCYFDVQYGLSVDGSFPAPTFSCVHYYGLGHPDPGLIVDLFSDFIASRTPFDPLVPPPGLSLVPFNF